MLLEQNIMKKNEKSVSLSEPFLSPPSHPPSHCTVRQKGTRWFLGKETLGNVILIKIIHIY